MTPMPRPSASMPDVILLNFTNVDYINSNGIALIVMLLAQRPQVTRPPVLVRTQRTLRRDLQHHATRGLHECLSG